MLVAVVGIQPIVATLILMVAGRGHRAADHAGQIITINSSPVQADRRTATGSRCRSRSSSSRRCTASTALVSRRTALGHADRVGRRQRRGEPPRRRPLPQPDHPRVRVLGSLLRDRRAHDQLRDQGRGRQQRRASGSSSTRSSPSSSAAPRSRGGRYFLAGTLVGALLIQTLTTTIYSIGIPPGDHAAVQGARRHRRLPAPVARLPRQGRPAAPPAREHR